VKCPYIKGKKPCGGGLLTKRTLANGNKVTRERYCPKCRNRFMTVEQFDSHIWAEKAKEQERVLRLEKKMQDLDLELEFYRNIFINLKSAVERAAKR
jgi:transcriptional regulator NrdR family protein